MNPYLLLAGVLALIGAYAGGRVEGRKMEIAVEARAERAAEKQRQQDQGQIDASSTRAATAETQRQADVRTVTHEKETIVERPVYRAECVDADGVGLWRRAAALASGKGLAQPAGTTAGAAGSTDDAGGHDDGQAMPVVGP